VKFLKIFLGLSTIGLIIAALILAPKKIIISEIDCQSQFGPCNASIQSIIDRVSNQEKSYYQTKQDIQGVLSNNILIRDYTYHFQFPSTLEVNILERKPKYAIKNGGIEAYALIDEEGYVIYFQDLTGLPFLVTNETPPNAGEKISEKTHFALEVLYGAFSSYQAREGKIEEESLVIELSQGPKVIFPLEGDKEVLLGSLRLVLSKLNSDSQDSQIENVSGARIIDLRFKNPVIK